MSNTQLFNLDMPIAGITTTELFLGDSTISFNPITIINVSGSLQNGFAEGYDWGFGIYYPYSAPYLPKPPSSAFFQYWMFKELDGSIGSSDSYIGPLTLSITTDSISSCIDTTTGILRLTDLQSATSIYNQVWYGGTGNGAGMWNSLYSFDGGFETSTYKGPWIASLNKYDYGNGSYGQCYPGFQTVGNYYLTGSYLSVIGGVTKSGSLDGLNNCAFAYYQYRPMIYTGTPFFTFTLLPGFKLTSQTDRERVWKRGDDTWTVTLDTIIDFSTFPSNYTDLGQAFIYGSSDFDIPAPYYLRTYTEMDDMDTITYSPVSVDLKLAYVDYSGDLQIMTVTADQDYGDTNTVTVDGYVIACGDPNGPYPLGKNCCFNTI